MRSPLASLAIVAVACSASAPSRAAELAHYDLRATLDPKAHSITVEGSYRDAAGVEHPGNLVKTIDHPIEAHGEDYARGFAETEGTILEEGAYLSGTSGWYPGAGDGLLTFDLTVTLPAGWDAMSQGRREVLERSATATRVRFSEPDPQEEIWLVAGPWTETRTDCDGIDALTLLRERDDALSARYLDATGPYLAMYEKLLGPYPYPKFALVENFWETGYGMPSFTLLGGKVIRLPFIINSSYPHEILHNWWGNGVFVTMPGGNWSEGLTAYLADHLFAEQAGNGAAYRQETLQKYADYAARSKDFPLASFTERHSPSTEAVGYGKSLMLFHMMRRELGDDVFVRGLRAFYADKRFQRAGFEDIRRALEKASGRDLAASFSPWVTRTGAPRLSVRGVKATQTPAGWHVTGTLVQSQKGAPYALDVPVAITLEGRDAALQSSVKSSVPETAFDLPVSGKPLRLDVDPEFDLFRILDVEEAPPALSTAFGADVSTMILPAGAEPELLAAYRRMADGWNAGRTAPMKIVTDAEIKELPRAGSVWVVGYENRYAARAGDVLRAHGGSVVRQADRAVALVARRARENPAVVAFVACARAAQVEGFARKLPHYHKYSHLAFEGDEPVNVEKGRWPVTDSPMTALLALAAAMGTLSPREPLAELPPAFSKDRMMATVRGLAAPEMKGRGYGTPELARAAESIAQAMKSVGLEVLPADPEARNVVGVLRGIKPEWADSSVVVGAHYDHLGVRIDTAYPGADDNASGVAVLIELARQMATSGKPSRTVIFVAFNGEESGLTGSKRYVASGGSWPAAKAIGMVNLDTVGRLGKGKILVLGSHTAGEWIHIVQGAGFVTNAPVEAVMSDPGGSDQKSFTDAGVPAVQLFTGPNSDYHQPTDTADKIDADGLVKVAAVAREIVAYLAERPEPLTSKLASSSAAAPGAAGREAAGERRVSLGTLPDYAFPGPGVRIGGVTPDSAADKAGLRVGDVIVKLGEYAISSLRDFSDVLKTRAPGERVPVTVQRGDRTVTVEATLTAR
jgi:hypothetical protein